MSAVMAGPEGNTKGNVRKWRNPFDVFLPIKRLLDWEPSDKELADAVSTRFRRLGGIPRAIGSALRGADKANLSNQQRYTPPRRQ